MKMLEILKDFFKKNSLLFYMVISFIFLEMIFHIFCFRRFDLFNIIDICLFTIPIALFFYFFSSLFTKKANKIITFIFIILITILFIAQFIYFNLFNAIFGLKSMGFMNQVIVVFNEVVTTIIQNWYVLLLMLLPLVFLIIFNKIINFEFNRKRNAIWTIFYIVAFYAISVLSISIDKESLYCNYNLYFKMKQPVLTANNLGLTTSFRLEVYRSITNFTEEVDVNDSGEKPIIEENTNYNMIDINFDYLNALTDDKDIKVLNNFFQNRQPTEQNEYTGLYKDKNLIVIVAESLDKSVITENLTPTLYKLLKGSINFNNYYVPLYPGSTGSGEYMTDWALLASNVAKTDQLTQTIGNTNPFRLNNSLKDLGYKTYAYHDYYGYFYKREDYFKNDNYDDYAFCKTGTVSECEEFRGSDLEMMKNTIDKYINQDKFFTYYLTVSGHGSYSYNESSIIRKNYDEVKDLNYSNDIKGLIAANKELDKALEYLVAKLEESGKLDDTVIVITPDHYPYYLKPEQLNELDSEDRTTKFSTHHQDLIIWSKNNPNITVDKYISNIDILPTILNLFGIEYDSRLFIGRDALSKVSSTVMLADQSWINEFGSYDTVENKFNQKGLIDENYVEKMNKTVNTYFNISNLIQEKKYYQFLLDNDQI